MFPDIQISDIGQPRRKNSPNTWPTVVTIAAAAQQEGVTALLITGTQAAVVSQSPKHNLSATLGLGFFPDLSHERGQDLLTAACHGPHWTQDRGKGSLQVADHTLVQMGEGLRWARTGRVDISLVPPG